MLDSYTLRVLLSVNTSGSFSAILGEEGNIQKDPTDFGPAETEVKEQGDLLATVTAKVKHKLLAGKRKPAQVRDLWSLLKCYTIKMQLKSV